MDCEESAPPAKAIGHPEAAAIEEGPALVNLEGIREYRVILFLSDSRGATKVNLATAFHMSRGAINTVVDHLIERGMITSEGKILHIAPRGKEALADLDRVDGSRLVKATYLDPKGKDAVRERRHDAAVADVAAKFRGLGSRWRPAGDGS